MAAKKTSKARRSAKPSIAIELRLADEALKVAVESGWESVSLRNLADRLGEPYGQVISVCPTTDHIAASLLRRIDATVLQAVTSIDDNEAPRDRLFEVMMMRFDALQGQREGYASLLTSYRRRPFATLIRVPGLLHSMGLMLVAAGIDASGLGGVARAHALAAAYGLVLRTWLKDESPDMAQTMSALDKNLERLEQLQSMCSGLSDKTLES